MNVCGLFLPLILNSWFHDDTIPLSSSREYCIIYVHVHFRRYAFFYNWLDLGIFWKNILQKYWIIVLSISKRLSLKINIYSSCDSISHYINRRHDIISLYSSMNFRLIVWVSWSYRAYNKILSFHKLVDLFLNLPRIPNTCHTSISTYLET